MVAGFAGCDDGGSDNGGAAGSIAIAGSPSGTAGQPPAAGGSGPVGTAGTAGTGGAVVSGEGVPLTPADGWVDVMSNTLGVQGAVFAFGDDTSKMGLVSDFVGDHACIKGTAALVDMTSTPCATMMYTPPATDCYGQFWGAAIGMNLNQPKDPVTGMGVEKALPFDASSLKGFSFDVSGTTVPAPKDLRFKVENASGEFCNVPTVKVKTGPNVYLFTDLVSECYKIVMDPPNPNADQASVKSSLLKISWQVVTNTTAAVPFDFCISNVRALPK